METPQINIIAPITMPAIVPPFGRPKQSCSAFPRSCRREAKVPVCRLAPHFTQKSAVSSFLVPHFGQYASFFPSVGSYQILLIRFLLNLKVIRLRNGSFTLKLYNMWSFFHSGCISDTDLRSIPSTRHLGINCFF